MNQVVMGAAIPFVIAAVIYAHRRGRAGMAMLIGTPIWMGAVAVWAVIPDIPRVLHMHSLYLHLARAPWTDIFLFHYTIDRIESYSPVYHALFLVMAAALIAAAWRELACAEGS